MDYSTSSCVWEFNDNKYNLTFPGFQIGDDVQIWIRIAEQHFYAYKVPDRCKNFLIRKFMDQDVCAILGAQIWSGDWENFACTLFEEFNHQKYSSSFNQQRFKQMVDSYKLNLDVIETVAHEMFDEITHREPPAPTLISGLVSSTANKKQNSSNHAKAPHAFVKKEKVSMLPIENLAELEKTCIEDLRIQFHPKLKFPVFHNDADLHPIEWLFKVERLFKLCKTPEDRKVDLASYHLEGHDPLDWLILYEHEFLVESSSWTHFVEKFLTRFVGYADIDAAMLRLNQEVGGGEVVEAYITEFVRLLSVASKKWSDNQLKGFFTNGLQEELRDEVRLYEPETLSEAIELARALKEKPQPIVLEDGDFMPQLPRYQALFMGKTRVKVLITRGSHNFIGPNVLKGSDKRLIIKENDPLMVHLMSTVGRINAQVNLQGFKYTADFYILPKLQGCDMMIGTEWYHAIETFTWSPDGNSFKANGKKYPLTAEKFPPGTITQPCSMSLVGSRKSERV